MPATLDLQNSLRRYTFGEAELRRAQMLSPDTLAYYEDLASEIATHLCSIVFSSVPEEQADQIKEYVRLKANRDCLINLLTEAQLAYSQQAAISP
jgi:hypothetical protein